MTVVFKEDTHQYFYREDNSLIELKPVSHYIREKYLILLSPPRDQNVLKFGSRIHKDIEEFFLNNREEDLLPSFRKFIRDSKDLFKNREHLLIEKIVYDINNKIAGTFDFLDVKRKLLIDWKTTHYSREILKEKYKEFIEDFNEGKFEKLNHYLFSYVLQQKLYQNLILKTLGIEVEKKNLVFLNKTTEEYTRINLEYVEKKLNTDDILKSLENMKEEWLKKKTLL
jgi:hypothetical protein